VDILANIATGGYYGLGKGLLRSVEQGKPGVGLDAFNNLGPYGSATYQAGAYGPMAARTGNMIIGGAALGAASGGGGASAAGAEGGGAAPASAGPEGIPFLSDPSGNVAYNVTVDPVTGAAGPGSGIPPSAIAGMSGGAGVGAGTGGGLTSALAGASGGMQLANMLGSFGGAPQPGMAGPGGPMMGAGGTQGLTQAQLAALGAQSSEAHKGLSPEFNKRMAGQKESPGMASTEDLSLAALYGLGGGR